MDTLQQDLGLYPILAAAIRYDASDVAIKNGSPPMVKVRGEWVPVEYLYAAARAGASALVFPPPPEPPMGVRPGEGAPFDLGRVDPAPLAGNRTEQLLEALKQAAPALEMGPDEHGARDASLQFNPDTLRVDPAFPPAPDDDPDRADEPDGYGLTPRDYWRLPERAFRVNHYRSEGQPATVLRILAGRVPTLEELHLPPTLYELTKHKRGLVLVTGATGSGKSSTLAALIDHINRTRRAHILTIEDPIEFPHRPQQSFFSHIEVGRDQPDFASALRAALRQAPDVILVGEMRDRETAQVAMSAAETGHLVLATLHTNDAPKTVDRLVNLFPSDQRGPVQAQLATVLLGIVAQILLPRLDQPGRIPAYEIMLNDPSTGISAAIREGKIQALRDAIATQPQTGMVSMDKTLEMLVRQGRVAPEVALAHATNPRELERQIGGRIR